MATPDHTPKGRGFQSSFGYFHHDNDYYTEIAGTLCDRTNIVDLWSFDKLASAQNGTIYEEAMFSLDVINNHDPSMPLFLYYVLVHTSFQVPDNYLKKFSFIDDIFWQYYHAMVNYLDDVVSDIVKALKDKDLWDNLLFVISSNNDGPEYFGGGTNNYPLRGRKMTSWQGGVRVNAFVSGGFLPEAQRGDGYIHLADWYGAFCKLAGVDQQTKPQPKPIYHQLIASICGCISWGRLMSLLVRMYQ